MDLQKEPSELLWLKLQENHLSVAKAAQVLGISRQQAHNLVSGQSAITAPMALKLEKLFEIKAEEWLALQAASDLARLRVSWAALG
jgi:addiction module HigA family antidote